MKQPGYFTDRGSEQVKLLLGLHVSDHTVDTKRCAVRNLVLPCHLSVKFCGFEPHTNCEDSHTPQDKARDVTKSVS